MPCTLTSDEVTAIVVQVFAANFGEVLTAATVWGNGGLGISEDDILTYADPIRRQIRQTAGCDVGEITIAQIRATSTLGDLATLFFNNLVAV